MPKLQSSINTGSDEFQANRAAMRALVADLAAKRATVAAGGPDRLKERHIARGKLLPRDRVMRLIDPGSPFLELSQLAAWDMYGDDIHGAGLITGVGRICARRKLRSRTACRASISSIAVAPICRIGPRSSPIASISAASSTIRRACRRKASRKSLW